MSKDLKKSSGILYIVATPIGNLDDITLRALKVLKEVDCILCEDKRVTVKLLNRFEIKKKLLAIHKFNEHESVENILDLLDEGKDIALVSDAGTPLISDPGKILVSSVIKNNIKVVPIPGPSAITSVLSICPFNCSEFTFLGFLPEKKNERKEALENLRLHLNTIVMFIAPHDLKDYLSEINEYYPDAEVFFAREITKIYEEIFYGNMKEAVDNVSSRKIIGEIVLCLKIPEGKVVYKEDEIMKSINQLILKGLSLKTASKQLASKLRLKSNYLYNLYLKNR